MKPVRPLLVPLPRLTKRYGGRDAAGKNAFPAFGTLSFSLFVPRAQGAAGAVLRICRDGAGERDLPFSFFGTAGDTDEYRLSLSLGDPAFGVGLYLYEILFLAGLDTRFTDTPDNAAFTLSDRSARRFSLLLYARELKTPDWFRGRVMYHIFVDRFAPGKGERRPDAFYHERWDEEICQYGAYPGAPVKNDEFFGGTLWGVLEKLPYLKSLGVGVVYLSPIFRAASNHKYDTGDYGEIDAQFGGEAAFRALSAACRKNDIRLVLDGVFNHTGDDSLFFNRYGHYPGVGAYQSPDSPYRDYYFFTDKAPGYECWWGVPILPKLNLKNPALSEYFAGEGGILSRYTRMGADGWRLDVADELPEDFLRALRARLKAETGGEGLLLGEVWENAATKCAYGKRRRYFWGDELDGVMNYPLRRGILSFVRDGDAGALAAVLSELWASYPTPVCHTLMNLLSTHDTERVLTALAGAPDDGTRDNDALCRARMSPVERRRGLLLLRMAALIQYTVFGVPSVFYGDEAGMEGYHDPFCRRPFPWGREEKSLQTFYRKLGKLRARESALSRGDFRILKSESHALVFLREDKEERLFVAANRGTADFSFRLPRPGRELLTGTAVRGRVTLRPDEYGIWRVGNV